MDLFKDLNAIITRHINSNDTNLNLTALEKKAVNLVECCDFGVCEINYKGVKGYILYDCQLGIYRHSDKYNNLDEYLLEYSVCELKDVTTLISDGMYCDYGFNTDKVFDDNVLDFEDCYYPDEEAL